MIKFFRNIRQRMVNENRVSKYLLYATGEIILVVIGILIALNINMYNGDRKDRAQERVLLETIQQDLRRDTVDMQMNLSLHRSTLVEESKLLEWMIGTADTTGLAIRYTDAFGLDLILTTHRSTYMNLQKHDVGLLRDHELHERIERHYDFFYTVMETVENSLPSYDMYSRKAPYFERHFRVKSTTSGLFHPDTASNGGKEDYLNANPQRYDLEPIDLEAMRADNAFQVVLSECIVQRKVVIQFYTDLLERTALLDGSISAYLNKTE